MFLKEHLSSIPGYKCPSSDRISQIFRKLSAPQTKYNDVQEHFFTIDKNLNRLMLKIIKQLNNIKGNILDYDNVIIFNNKYDSSWTYKKEKGYQPGVSFIGKAPVYIEGRSGKSPAVYRIEDTLERTLELLKENDIKVKYFRSDAAAYKKSVIKLMNKSELDYFIRVKKSPHLLDTIKYNIRNWERIFVKGIPYEIGEGDFVPFEGSYKSRTPKFYRIVVTRFELRGAYQYRAIITNNRALSKDKVLEFYNNRGAIERNFDDLKNNFNWCRLPFSALNENTTFLIISAIGYIIYYYLVEVFGKKLDFVKRNFRLKNFIFHFITVSSIWNREGLTLFSQKRYEVLLE